MVKEDADLTRFAGIGSAIASAIREIVLTGSLSKLERMRSEAAPEVASPVDYPRLDPKRVLRIYKKLDADSDEGNSVFRSDVDKDQSSAEAGSLMVTD
jgi:DNA polymerase (family 10)